VKPRHAVLALAFVGVLPEVAVAAGGHHAVDDAAILDPGQCEAEGWLDRAKGGARSWHLGSSCRAGAIELGLAADRLDSGADADGGALRQTDLSAELKWAMAFDGRCSVGAVLGSAWQGRPRRYAMSSVVVPLSCARGAWAVHLNAGIDLVRGSRDEFRGGIAVERALTQRLQGVAELFSESGTARWRTALRLSEGSWSIDLGHHRPFSSRGERGWTLGLAKVFG
jgi:hypothetical protein